MKITITSGKPVQNLKEAVKKLKSFVENNEFFWLETDDGCDRIWFGHCANSELHNRLLALIALFLHEDRGYQSLNNEKPKYAGFFRVHDVPSFCKFVESIPHDIEDMQIEFD